VKRDLVSNSPLTEHNIDVVPVSIRVEDVDPPSKKGTNIDTSQMILTMTNLKYKGKFEGKGDGSHDSRISKS
jgi:hypothetical protein